MSSLVTSTERSISAGSRPMSAQWSSSTRHLWAITSGAPKPCQVSAHCATSRSITLSPPPPISTGILPRTGGGLSLPEARVDHGQGFAEGVQPRDRGTELVAVLGVVALEPARAQPEDQAAAGDVIDGARHVGEQVRVAVGVAGHERAEVDALGGLGHRSEQAPALEMRALGVAEQRMEVIPGEQRVGALRHRRAARCRASACRCSAAARPAGRCAGDARSCMPRARARRSGGS